MEASRHHAAVTRLRAAVLGQLALQGEVRIKDVLERKQNNKDIFSQLMFGEVALQLLQQIKRMNLRISCERVKKTPTNKEANFCHLCFWGDLLKLFAKYHHGTLINYNANIIGTLGSMRNWARDSTTLKHKRLA